MMYQTVGSLLPNYALSAWFAARPDLLLHDDAGRLVTTNMSLGCPSHRPGDKIMRRVRRGALGRLLEASGGR